MANRQVDPGGPYNHGYQDAELGLPLASNPYIRRKQSDEYMAGWRAAKLAEKSPA
jgi:ribosome modulation factor